MNREYKTICLATAGPSMLAFPGWLASPTRASELIGSFAHTGARHNSLGTDHPHGLYYHSEGLRQPGEKTA